MSFLENKPSQMELYPIITALFCGCLIISNILASKTFSLYDIILPCGVVIFHLFRFHNKFNSCHSISNSHIFTWYRPCNFKCIQHYFRKHSKDIDCQFNLISCRILCKRLFYENTKGKIHRLPICQMFNKHIVWWRIGCNNLHYNCICRINA